jgi:hypothetical protein
MLSGFGAIVAEVSGAAFVLGVEIGASGAEEATGALVAEADVVLVVVTDPTPEDWP